MERSHKNTYSLFPWSVFCTWEN